MPAIISSLLSGASGLLGGIWLYAIVAAVAGAGAGWTVHEIDSASYEALQLKDATAATKAVQAQAAAVSAVDAKNMALASANSAAALAEAQAQTKIVTRTVTLTKEIPVYVTPKADASVCIPYGLVRVLDAAALSGVSDIAPSDLALPAGQSDDSCAPVKASDLASSVAANYTAAEANAEQLNALERWVADLEILYKEPAP